MGVRVWVGGCVGGCNPHHDHPPTAPTDAFTSICQPTPPLQPVNHHTNKHTHKHKHTHTHTHRVSRHAIRRSGVLKPTNSTSARNTACSCARCICLSVCVYVPMCGSVGPLVGQSGCPPPPPLPSLSPSLLPSVHLSVSTSKVRVREARKEGNRPHAHTQPRSLPPLPKLCAVHKPVFPTELQHFPIHGNELEQHQQVQLSVGVWECGSV